MFCQYCSLTRGSNSRVQEGDQLRLHRVILLVSSVYPNCFLQTGVCVCVCELVQEMITRRKSVCMDMVLHTCACISGVSCIIVPLGRIYLPRI